MPLKITITRPASALKDSSGSPSATTEPSAKETKEGILEKDSTPLQDATQVNEKEYEEGFIDLQPDENYREIQYGPFPNVILKWEPTDKVRCSIINDNIFCCERRDKNKKEQIDVDWHINER